MVLKALNLESKIEIHTLQLFVFFYKFFSFFEKISKYILLDIHYIQEENLFLFNKRIMLKLYQELMRLFEINNNWLLLLNIPFKLQLI
jgi:hypothetical protein